MPLPEEIKSVLLEERTGLTQQGEQNLRVLAGGSANARQVSVALRGTDTTSQKLTGTPAQCTFYLSDNATLPENDEESREVCLLDCCEVNMVPACSTENTVKSLKLWATLVIFRNHTGPLVGDECAKLAGRLEREQTKRRKNMITNQLFLCSHEIEKQKPSVNQLGPFIQCQICGLRLLHGSRERQRKDLLSASCRPLSNAECSHNSWTREAVQNFIRDWRHEPQLRPFSSDHLSLEERGKAFSSLAHAQATQSARFEQCMAAIAQSQENTSRAEATLRDQEQTAGAVTSALGSVQSVEHACARCQDQTGALHMFYDTNESESCLVKAPAKHASESVLG